MWRGGAGRDAEIVAAQEHHGWLKCGTWAGRGGRDVEAVDWQDGGGGRTFSSESHASVHIPSHTQVSPHAKQRDLATAKYISILNVIQGEVDPTQVWTMV